MNYSSNVYLIKKWDDQKTFQVPLIYWTIVDTPNLFCKAKKQYLLTSKINRYCILAVGLMLMMGQRRKYWPTLNQHRLLSGLRTFVFSEDCKGGDPDAVFEAHSGLQVSKKQNVSSPSTSTDSIL